MSRSLLVAAVLGSTAIAHGQALFLIDGAGGYPGGVSDGGAVVSGVDPAGYWYWTEKGGLVRIGGVPPGQGVGGQAVISRDGTRMVAGEFDPRTGKVEAHLFEIESFSWQSLGSLGFSCDLGASSGWGISGDGSTVVGLAWEAGCQGRAFRWREDGGMTSLGTLFFFRPTRANAANDDGSVIVGWNDTYTGFRQATRWVDGVQQMLFGPGGVRLPEAGAVSGDGVWVGGIGAAELGGEAWRWSADSGYQSLGPVPIAGLRGYVTGLSGDGSVALCFFRAGPPATSGEGYLWIAGEGFVPLEEYAISQGVKVPPDLRFALPLAISRDGRNIVGTARTGSGDRPFLLRLGAVEPECPADLDGSGVVDAADLAILLASWGGPGGDLDGDGTTGGGDLAILLGAWGPCP